MGKKSTANLSGKPYRSAIWWKIFDSRCSRYPFTSPRGFLSGGNGSFLFCRQKYQRKENQCRNTSKIILSITQAPLKLLKEWLLEVSDQQQRDVWTFMLTNSRLLAEV